MPGAAVPPPQGLADTRPRPQVLGDDGPLFAGLTGGRAARDGRAREVDHFPFEHIVAGRAGQVVAGRVTGRAGADRVG